MFAWGYFILRYSYKIRIVSVVILSHFLPNIIACVLSMLFIVVHL